MEVQGCSGGSHVICISVVFGHVISESVDFGSCSDDFLLVSYEMPFITSTHVDVQICMSQLCHRNPQPEREREKEREGREKPVAPHAGRSGAGALLAGLPQSWDKSSKSVPTLQSLALASLRQTGPCFYFFGPRLVGLFCFGLLVKRPAMADACLFYVCACWKEDCVF